MVVSLLALAWKNSGFERSCLFRLQLGSDMFRDSSVTVDGAFGGPVKFYSLALFAFIGWTGSYFVSAFLEDCPGNEAMALFINSTEIVDELAAIVSAKATASLR